jgi:hypothetical protein
MVDLLSFLPPSAIPLATGTNDGRASIRFLPSLKRAFADLFAKELFSGIVNRNLAQASRFSRRLPLETSSKGRLKIVEREIPPPGPARFSLDAHGGSLDKKIRTDANGRLFYILLTNL